MKTYSNYGIVAPDTGSGEYRTICPKCEPQRTHKGGKDLSVNLSAKTWYCHHCGFTGGLASRDDYSAQLYTLQRMIDEREEDEVFIPPNLEILSESGLQYLASRGISKETAETVGVKSAVIFFHKMKGKAEAIAFPIIKDGEIANVKYRCIAAKDFTQSSGGDQTALFNGDSMNEAETIIFTEGEFDTLSVMEAGYLCAVSCPNGAPPPNAKNIQNKLAFIDANITFFDAAERVILAMDNDAPGIAFQKLVAERIGVEKCFSVEYPAGCKDCNDVLVKHGKAALIACIDATKPFPAADLRGITSPRNGSQGGRKPIPVEVLAKRFLSYIKKPLKSYQDEWFIYTGKVYQRIPRNDLDAMIFDFLQNVKPKEKELQDLKISNSMTRDIVGNLTGYCNLSALKQAPFFIDNIGNGKDWLAMDNGLINIEKLTGKINGNSVAECEIFKVHTPDLFSTFAIGYNYDPAADCPCFIKYLNEVQPEADSRECLQMLAGLALIPDTRYEVIFILYGEGGTGKSVFLHILEKLVDSSNVCCLPLAKFAEKHSAHLLTEHLLNIVGDLPTAAEGSSLHHIEGYLKDVASGGLLPVERKNKDPYKAPAIARCIFASNSLPTFADRSNGIWDRLRIVSFNQRFRDTEKQNSNLKYEIAAQELPGILNWAIAGLAKLRKQARFPNTTAGKAIRDKHRNDCDHERQFLDEYYTEMNGCYVVKSDMYKEYREWSSSAGFRYKNSSNFYNDVLRALPKAFETRERIAGHNSRIFKNIARVGQI